MNTLTVLALAIGIAVGFALGLLTVRRTRADRDADEQLQRLITGRWQP